MGMVRQSSMARFKPVDPSLVQAVKCPLCETQTQNGGGSNKTQCANCQHLFCQLCKSEWKNESDFSCRFDSCSKVIVVKNGVPNCEMSQWLQKLEKVIYDNNLWGCSRLDLCLLKEKIKNNYKLLNNDLHENEDSETVRRTSRNKLQHDFDNLLKQVQTLLVEKEKNFIEGQSQSVFYGHLECEATKYQTIDDIKYDLMLLESLTYASQQVKKGK